MSDYRQKLQNIKLGIEKPDGPKPKKPLRPVSLKKQRQMREEKQQGVIIDPNEFYTYHMKHSVPVCEECGFEAPWLLDPAYEKLWRACQAHVLPKRPTMFPSLRNNLENHLVIFPSFGGKLCGCHGFYDSSWFNASTMKIWGKAVQVFIDLYPRIPERELKNIPEVFLPYIN